MIFAMYPFLYRPSTEATKEKLEPPIFIVSTFYTVHQGVKRENGKRLKCCEILSLRICFAPESILQWSPACDVTREEIQKSSEKILIYPHFILCQKWMLQQPRALLWLINPDSFDEIIRQRGEILVTVSEFMTVLPLANVTQLQNSAGLMLSLDWVVSVTNIIPDSRQLM